MKKLFSLLLFVAVAAAVTGQEINDPNAELRKVEGSFTAIKVSNAIDLYLTQGQTESVAVSAANAEYRNKIRTTVEGGVLKIWYDDDNKFWKNGSNKKLKAYVSVKTLNKLTASGASDVYAQSDLKSTELELRFSGASDFRGGAVFANQLTVDVSGASDVNIKGGQVKSVRIEASGASDFNGYDLVAEDCSARATGASDIKVTVNNELDAHASGASGIYYKGTGKIQNVHSSGASSVSRRS